MDIIIIWTYMLINIHFAAIITTIYTESKQKPGRFI